MNRWIKRGLCASLLTFGLVGCDNPEPGGVRVDAPGVDVNAGPGGAKIQAPGVDIEAGRGGVKVDAPNADVDIKTPGTNP
jgi:hypothetical protein